MIRRIVASMLGLALAGCAQPPPAAPPPTPATLDEFKRAAEAIVSETGIPNVVTAVLASYRGYDTLGETTVIFTAGIGVLLLLKRTLRRPAGDGRK